MAYMRDKNGRRLDSIAIPDLSAVGLAAFETQRATALRPWFAALANRDNAPANVLTLGHSLTEGIATTAPANRWINRLNDLYRARFPVAGNPVGTSGYQPVFYGTYSTYIGTQPATLAGAPAQVGFGLGKRSVQLDAAGKTVTFTFTGTGADLLYATNATGSGVMGVQVDGGTVTNVTLPATTFLDGNVRQIRGLSAGSHTVVVSWVSGGPVVVDGLMPYNGDESKGIRVWDGGRGSYKVSDLISGTAWQGCISAIQPALVTVEFGINEYNNNVTTSATFGTQLQTLLANVRAKCTLPPSIVLIADYASGTATYAEPWSAYVSQMYAAAAADTGGRTLVFDLTQRIPAVATDNTLGLISGDNVHPSNKGAAFIADALASFTAPR